MRRFEFTQGTSNKFWQVEQTGSEVTTQWGRIGTDGQTKTKALATPEKAEAEMAKQIRSKEKKGYVEVDAPASTPAVASELPEPEPTPETPQPEPPKPVAVAAPPPEPEPIAPTGRPEPFVQPHDLPVSPVRGSTTADPIDLEAAARRSRLSVRGIEQARRSKLTGSVAALLDEAIAALTTADLHVSGRLDLEALCGALVDRVDLWVHHRGLAFAVEAQLLADGFSSGWDGVVIRDAVPSAVRWRRLRTYGAAADETEWQELVDVIDRRFPSAPIGNQIAMAYLLADADRARTAFEAAQQDPSHRDRAHLLMLLALLPVDEATALAKARPYLRGVAIGDLYEAFGTDAVRVLVPVIEAKEYERAEHVAHLARIHSDAAAEALVRLLDDPQARGTAQAGLLGMPWFALPALARSRSLLASALLRQVARAHPHVADAVLPSLEAEAAQRLRSARPVEEPFTDAPPPLLVDPPWANRPKPTKPVVIRLTPKEGPPEAVVWQGDEKERFARRDPEAWSDRFYYLQDLATKGIEALDGIVSRDYAAEIVAGCYRVRSSRLAPTMAHGFAHLKSVRREAQIWLESFPEAAAVRLVPQALGKAGKDRRAAEKALRATDRYVVLEVAQRYGDDVKAAIVGILDADPLLVELPKKMPSLPEGIDPAGLVPPRMPDGRPLPPDAVHHLLLMVAVGTPEQPYSGLEQVEAELDPDSLAPFGWSLFTSWYLSGAEGKTDWAFTVLGRWGNDDVARKLTPMLKKWPGESAHARAVKGLDVLAGIGTDVALMLLHGLSVKLRYKGLKAKAGEKIEQIAQDRGLSPLELADRLVPDCGLDPDGATVLDFGPRAFTVGFDEHLKPFVRDETGKKRANLPKPGKSDDAEVAKESAARWKAIKKDVRAIASTQVKRLELAMCSQRRWSVDVFRTFLLEHPLMVHLVRRVVWGAWREGVLVGTFRVTEDRTLADADDEAFALPDDVEIGIPHPLGLDPAVAAAWGDVLADYEIIAPFPQLARETFSPSPSEAKGATLGRVAGKIVPWGRVVGLESQGWRKGYPQDAGWIWEMTKAVGDGLQVSLDLKTGLASWSLPESEDQELGDVTLYVGRRKSASFGDVGPVAYSELVRDLEGLLA